MLIKEKQVWKNNGGIEVHKDRRFDHLLKSFYRHTCLIKYYKSLRRISFPNPSFSVYKIVVMHQNQQVLIRKISS